MDSRHGLGWPRWPCASTRSSSQLLGTDLVTIKSLAIALWLERNWPQAQQGNHKYVLLPGQAGKTVCRQACARAVLSEPT